MSAVIKAELDKLKRVCRNSRDVSPETIDLYTADLDDLPTESVVQAIRELRKSSVFFPALAEIRNRVVAIVGESVLVNADACWDEVRRNIRRYGASGVERVFIGGEMTEQRMTWSSPIIERAIQQFDWRELCTTDTEKNPTYMTTVRAQFRNAVRSIQDGEVDRIVSGRATASSGLTRLAAGGNPALADEVA